MAHAGHCLCGAVRYALDHEIEAITNCHCQFCRRVHGAAFVTTAFVPSSALRVTAGEDEIARYQGRYFCRICGTRLYNRAESFPDATVLMVASLDPEPALKPAFHFNVESMAPWHEILDDRPRYDGFPPAIQAAMDASRTKEGR